MDPNSKVKDTQLKIIAASKKASSAIEGARMLKGYKQHYFNCRLLVTTSPPSNPQNLP
jgi:hypothetical protein